MLEKLVRIFMKLLNLFGLFKLMKISGNFFAKKIFKFIVFQKKILKSGEIIKQF